MEKQKHTLGSLNLKTKIIGLMLLILLGSFWLQILVTTEQIEHDIIELLSTQQFAAASYIASDIDDKIKLRIDVLKGNAANLTPELISSSAKMKRYLMERPALAELFKGGVALVSSDGIGIADYPPAPGRQGGSFKELSYFNEVMATGEVALGKPRIGLYTKQPGAAIGVPVKDKSGAVIAVLEGFSTFSDTTLFGQAEKSNFGKSGYVIIIDPKHHLVVTSSDSSRILTPLPQTGVNAMLDRAISGYEGSGITVNSRGIESLVSAKRVPAAGWIVMVVLPTQEAFVPIWQLQRKRYEIAGLLSVLAVFLGWGLLRRTLRPLETATSAIQDMVSGKATLHELPVIRNDEIGGLFAGFNLLVEQRQKVEQAFEKLAQTDSLTNLANRRFFMEEAEQELSRTVRYGGPMSMLMMDIDHFKNINDTYGHKTGDIVLQKLAQLYREALREVDIIGRLGGEEFAVLLPQTGSEQAFEVAERLNKMVADLAIPLEQGLPLHLTISIGVTTLVDSSSNIDTLLSQADTALYQAKRSGRNRVCVFQAE